jgi:hypothetical protein
MYIYCIVVCRSTFIYDNRSEVCCLGHWQQSHRNASDLFSGDLEKFALTDYPPGIRHAIGQARPEKWKRHVSVQNSILM